MKTSLLLLSVILTGCTLPSTLYNTQTGEHVTLGGSLGTRSAKEQAVAVSASGTMLSYSIEGKSETDLAKFFFAEKAIGELATAARQAFSSANVTRRALGAQSVRKVAIRADRAVQLKALDAVVPEATLLPVP